jgi:hypothetical protein
MSHKQTSKYLGKNIQKSDKQLFKSQKIQQTDRQTQKQRTKTPLNTTLNEQKYI